MANQAKKISVVSGAGLLTQVWTSLDAEVRRLSGDNSVDHLHRLATEQGANTIRTMAQVIVNDGEKTYRPGLVNDRQMQALEYFISKSTDATDYAKKAIVWALRQTNNLARNIAVPFSYDWDREKTQEIAYGVHDMRSSNGSTLIQVVFKTMDVERSISSHCGLYQDAKYNTSLSGYTIWVAERDFDHTADVLEPDFAMIEAIDLSGEVILDKSFWDSFRAKAE